MRRGGPDSSASCVDDSPRKSTRCRWRLDRREGRAVDSASGTVDGQHLDRSIARLQRRFAGESLIGLSPVAADCWDRFDLMEARSEPRRLPEPFEVPWTEGTRDLRPRVRPGPYAPLLMRLNRNPFSLVLPWVKREEYWNRRVDMAAPEPFSASRAESNRLRIRMPFSSPALDRYVPAAPPTLRDRRCS